MNHMEYSTDHLNFKRKNSDSSDKDDRIDNIIKDIKQTLDK